MSVVLPILIPAISAILTLVYASYCDLKDRYVPPWTWYPMLVIGIPSVIFYYTNLGLSNGWSTVIAYVFLSLMFSCVMFFLARKRLLGGADAKVLICIAICIPVFPIDTYFGTSFTSTLLGFLPFAVLSNAITFACIAPIYIYLQNVIKGNRAPFPYMFFAFPVDGNTIQNTYGYVIEDIDEKDEVLTRQFVGIRRSLQMTGMYTKNLRLHPERYERELALYKKAGVVWISYAIPFIVFITAGLVCAIVFGDPVYAIMKVLL